MTMNAAGQDLETMTVDQKIEHYTKSMNDARAVGDWDSAGSAEANLVKLQQGYVVAKQNKTGMSAADALHTFVDWLCNLDGSLGPIGRAHAPNQFVAAMNQFIGDRELGDASHDVQVKFLERGRREPPKAPVEKIEDFMAPAANTKPLAPDPDDAPTAPPEELQGPSDGTSGVSVTADESELLADIMPDKVLGPLARKGLLTFSDMKAYLGTTSRPAEKLEEIKGIGDSRARAMLRILRDRNLL